jgi:acyl-CoA thioester hydrolase
LVRNLAIVRVLYADTDAMGIVYHTNYIKWFEIGRSEIFRQMDLLYSEVEKHGFSLPVTEVYCKYLLPAKYDQLLVVETIIDYISRVVIKFNYNIWDEHKKHQYISGYTMHACTNAEGKVRRIPPILLDLKSKYNIKGE